MPSLLLMRVFLTAYTACREVIGTSSNDWHYIGENIALHKPTEQTPGTYEGYNSSLAVDGIDDNNFPNGSCSHTSASAWYNMLPIASWKVFLGGMYPLTGIIILNRAGSKLVHQWGTRSRTWRELYNDNGKHAYMNDTIHIPLDGSVLYSNIAVNLPKHRGSPDDSVSYLSLCEVKVYAGGCPHIEKSRYVTAVMPDFQLYHLGEAVTIICEYGYKTTDKNPIVCQSEGNWDSSIPTCHPIKCPQLENPVNGRYLVLQPSSVPHNNSNLGTEIRAVCDTGYDSDTDQKRVCQNDSTWSGLETICTRVLCNHPRNITNGVYVFQNNSRVLHNHTFTYKTVLKQSCHEGYTLRGQTERICQSDKTWSGVEPNCDIVTCDFPGKFNNGHYVIQNDSSLKDSNQALALYRGGKLNFSTEIRSVCLNNYTLRTSNHSRRCNSTGVWTGEIPRCGLIVCKWPIQFNNGHYTASYNATPDGMPYNTTLTASCNEMYKLSERFRPRRCNEEAIWDRIPPLCEPLCKLPNMTNGQFINVMTTTFKLGTSLRFTCGPGFTSSSDNEEITCQENHEWSSNPECVESDQENQMQFKTVIIVGVTGPAFILLAIVFVILLKRR